MLDILKIRVGDKVICVQDYSTLLKKCETYTISDIFVIDSTTDIDYVRLYEFGDMNFFLSRFDINIKETRKQKLKKLYYNA